MDIEIKPSNFAIVYIINLFIVGTFYFFGMIEHPTVYIILLRSTALLSVLGILMIYTDNAIKAYENGDLCIQRHSPPRITDAVSIVCLIAVASPAFVCVFECVILKVVFYGIDTTSLL